MPNTYTLLETITVGAAGASSVTFNSIPQTGYTDLVVKASVRSTVAEDGFGPRFNSDSGSNYTYLALVGQGASVSSFSGTTTYLPIGRMSESGYTANTFGNCEFYIPNYVSSNQKSVSVDAVNENNATTARAQLAAGLWSGTAAITTVQFIPGAGSFAQFSTFSLYGVSALGTTPTKAPKATGGSIIQTDGTYWYHAFLSSGTFTPVTGLSCDVLVVAGGGGGGRPVASQAGGGGGGAGGLLYYASQSVGASDQTITIGAGGAGTTGTAAQRGSTGSNSQFAALTASVGGGGGGAYAALETGLTGGSGGGAAGGLASFSGGSATSGQGNAGGSTVAGSPYTGAGGGGASAVGGSAGNTTAAGSGGAGSSAYSSFGSITGLGQNVSGTYWFAGGGGGASGNSNGNYGLGGNGGGGRGADGLVGNTSSVAGTANTGGGGGAGAQNNGGGAGTTFQGQAGGSGVVIIRYLA
jgi:hypothetical protein